MTKRICEQHSNVKRIRNAREKTRQRDGRGSERAREEGEVEADSLVCGRAGEVEWGRTHTLVDGVSVHKRWLTRIQPRSKTPRTHISEAQGKVG